LQPAKKAHAICSVVAIPIYREDTALDKTPLLALASKAPSPLRFAGALQI
jgi:hypothetical protein